MKNRTFEKIILALCFFSAYKVKTHSPEEEGFYEDHNKSFPACLCGGSAAGVFFAHPAAAKKRYRYIKRMHGAKIQWNLQPFQKPADGVFSLGSLNIDLAYSYNHKGLLEFGPYLSVNGMMNALPLANTAAGLSLEYNFVKNRGKRKNIPALGLQIGVQKGAAWDLAVSPYFSFKYFVAKRTALVTSLKYTASLPFNGLAAFMQNLSHGVFLVGGFAYYFDFY